MIKLTFKITTTFMLFLLIFVSCKKDIIDEAQVAQNGYHVVATNKENKLLNLLDNMKLTVANGKQSSILEGLDLAHALKKTDEQGNVFYSLYVDSEDPLSLVNVSLNEIEGELFGRVLYQRIDEDWLLRQETFPGWGNYTGTFRVTDLEGDILYEVNVDNGSSASEVSTNGRAYCISELTKTQETCIPDLSICYPQYEWITSCEWFWAGGNYIGSGGPANTPPGSSGGSNGSNTIGVGVYNPGFADEDMSDLIPTWPEDLVILDIPGKQINDINDYLKCFDISQGASLSIYVDQPTSNSSATWSGSITDPYVGHTFISITQGTYTRVFGFYPKGGVIPKISPKGTSILKDDSEHIYNVSVTLDIDKSELVDILDLVTTYNGTYNLNSYNCSDFAQDVSAFANLVLPDTQGNWPGGGGTNPGNLGQDIRSMSSENGITVVTSFGNAPKNTGNCN